MSTNDVEYLVVRNDEDQHSIWFAHRPLPAGWHETGFRGSKEECLANIEQVWPDITPLSVRTALGRA
ncbi:MAG: MbtH family protein [Saccharothrix sp.]|nr:MbtH family protein [Saccharothrix sp.]